jgi:hypothetical protein
VLKRTSASIGLVVAAAAGAPLTSAPAYAQANIIRGSHSHHSHHSHHRNRNWNGNRHRARIFIRIYVYNKNNNHAVAIARPEHREASPTSSSGGDPFFGLRRQRTVTGQDVARRAQDVARPGQDLSGTGQGTAGTAPVG